ncbi:MAG: metallophosphoesterase family protein [Thiomargarita sp.]|nr:metallophosphoesterase family protein [Bacteroidales bacterium]MCK5719318.1 metallophosphoesterase family protein [Thiomargarita sp.]
MKICILSDSHDNIPLLRNAAAKAKQQGAEAILHCGDIVAPSTLNQLKAYQLPVHAIHGNNTGDLYNLSRLSNTNNTIYYYGQDATFTLAKKRIFLVHYPHYAQAMAITGDYDLVCCGHSHRVSIDKITNIKGEQTILCNPGSVGGIGATATYIFGDLETMTFEAFPVNS